MFPNHGNRNYIKRGFTVVLFIYVIFVRIDIINKKTGYNMTDKKKKKGVKGKADKDSADTNPLLYIEDKKGFTMQCGNLLQDNDMLIFHGYESFDIKKEKEHFDMERLNRDSSIIISLRYYEYVCIVKFDFEYIIPIMESGLIAKDVFDMMKHCLKNKMMLLAPSWETVFEPDFCYNGYIKY